MNFQDHVGQTETRDDIVAPHLMQGLAATLGMAAPSRLPPLWHWMLFQEWVMPDRLGLDGHPRRGGFLPPVHDLPRRMWAGGTVRFLAPLHTGEAVRRTSTIRSVTEKQGGSGRLVFVTVDHAIEGPHGPAIAERQDIVYRGAEGPAAKPAEPAPPAPPDARRDEARPDPVLLFRYSALTGNGHRIHYDLDYARGAEGYPGLVVHGPLQAMWLAGLLADKTIAAFSFRGLRPAFHDAPLVTEGWAEGDVWRLRTLDPGGRACMTAEATLG